MLAAYKRYAKLVSTEGYECRITERSGEIGLYQQQLVVAQIDPDLIEAGLEDTQMLLSEARKLKADAEVGDILETEVTPTPDEFGRIAAQSAKQVITQKIREAEKFLIMREFEEKKNQVTTGIVQRIEGRNVIINIGKSEAVLPPRGNCRANITAWATSCACLSPIFAIRDACRRLSFRSRTPRWFARFSSWKCRKSKTT